MALSEGGSGVRGALWDAGALGRCGGGVWESVPPGTRSCPGEVIEEQDIDLGAEFVLDLISQVPTPIVPALVGSDAGPPV